MRRMVFGGVSVSLMMALMSGTALAQEAEEAPVAPETVEEPDNAGPMETMIVTAQKREQSIQDVPIAVSAYTGDFLEETGTDDVFDLQFFTPSLVVTQSQSSIRSSFAIRGVGTSSQNAGLESSVGLFVDGVFRQQQGSVINDLVDVERIEILRGPQGTLFGKNTASGGISIVTRAPEFTWGGFTEVTAGNFGHFNINGAVTGPIVEDVLAFRATGFYTDQNGFAENLTTGEFFNDRNRFGGRFQLLFTPTSNVDVRIIADYAEIDEVCCATGTFLTGPTDFAIQALGGNVLPGEDFFNREVTADVAPVARTEDWGVSAEINWAVAGHTVTSITAFRSYQSFDNIDGDFTDLDILRESSSVLDQEAVTHETRIANDGGGKLQYVAGVFYFTQDLDTFDTLLVGDDANAYLNLVAGTPLEIPVAPGVTVPVDFFPAGEGANNLALQDQRSIAIFAQADYAITENFIFTGGIRYTNERKALVNTFTETIPLGPDPLVDPLGAFVPGAGFYLFPPLAPQPDVDTTLNESQVTGTAKLSYYLNDETLVYASYGRGFKSGGTNTDRVPPLAPLLFEAETTDAYEIGLKTDLLDGVVRINAAGHYTTYDDFQSNTFVGTGFFLQNAGELETFGGEVEIFAAPTDWLFLTTAVAYLDATYGSFEQGPCQLVSVDPNPNGDGSCDRTGDRLPQTSKWTVISTATAEQPLTNSLTGYVRGEVNYRTDYQTDTNNDPLKLQDGFAQVNFRAGLRSIDDHWELAAWVRNATNTDFTVIRFDPPIQDGKLNAYPNEPRTYGVTLTARY